MQINSIEIKNFRCFERFEATFHHELTVIVGNNGSGKSTLLDAASIAIGTFLAGFDGTSSPGISKDDALNKCYDMGSVVELQPQFPVSISASGVIGGTPIAWKRELRSAEGKTTVVDAKEITAISAALQDQVRNGEKPVLPLISYYGTGRLWAQKREKKSSELMKFNRQMGYVDCLDAASNEKMMRKWFEKMTLQSATNGTQAPELSAVKSAIIQCFQGITGFNDVDVQFNLDTHELDILYRDGNSDRERYPMKELSDGYKNTLSMVADIAYRMAVLNPWLLDDVLKETTGIVLIDEIDLHLHPQWQQRIIGDLRTIFPKVQFIVSTHAPLVINSVKKENLLILTDQQAVEPQNEVFGRDANAILSSVMGASERPSEIKQMFQSVYDAIDEQRYDDAALTLQQIEDKIGSADPELTSAQVSLELERM